MIARAALARRAGRTATGADWPSACSCPTAARDRSREFPRRRRRCWRRPSCASRPCRPSSRSCGRVARRRAGGRSADPSTSPAAAPSCRRTSTAGSPAVRRSTRAIAPSRSAISVSALSHEIGSNWPLPLGPTRRSGVTQPLVVIGALDVAIDLRARKPCVNGWSGSPATRTARPFSTVTSIAQVSGQSCGHAPRTTPSRGMATSSEEPSGEVIAARGDFATYHDRGGSAKRDGGAGRSRWREADVLTQQSARGNSLVKRALQQNRKHMLPSVVARSVAIGAVLLRLAAKPLTRFHLAIDLLLTPEIRNLSFTPPTGHPIACADQRVISHKTTLRRIT